MPEQSIPDLLEQEWEILHQDHERYDHYALLIKLAAILSCLLSLAYDFPFLLALLFNLTLWFQEGIWRTFQSRIAERLLFVEKAIEENNSRQGLQLYSSWEEQRPGTIGLIKSYVTNSARPTVAFPYIALIIISGIALVYYR